MNSDNLFIVMPAYNEESNIGTVAREWHNVVASIGPSSRLVIFNDGSKDRTLEQLRQLEVELPQLIGVDKPNSGHGATVQFAYRYALDNGADFIFQTDSDGQTLPQEFEAFWEKRREYDVIIGHRKGRQDGFSRILVTKVLKWVIRFIFKEKITDANTPFRLMSRDVLSKYIDTIPKDYNLSNVLLTVRFVKGKAKVLFIPITFRPRQGGVNSINFRRITKIGKQAVKDFRQLR
ncbi:MAG: glycosyltransferase family 2 protein [Clostridiaceae bacterium]|nr:glycosyltransferase family 2 protein [Clostridiaceae bacterium]